MQGSAALGGGGFWGGEGENFHAIAAGVFGGVDGEVGGFEKVVDFAEGAALFIEGDADAGGDWDLLARGVYNAGADRATDFFGDGGGLGAVEVGQHQGHLFAAVTCG